MAETDFTLFGDTAADIHRGATAGFTPPSGGGNYVFGFSSISTGAKAVGLYYTSTKFAPMRDDDDNATGGSVRGVLKRGTSPQTTGYSIALFINLQAYTTADTGYFLGLSDNDPHEIVLAKTALISGIPATGTGIVLRKSTETFSVDTWVHLRLDAICNPNGDVILKCFKNDLDNHVVTSPVWEAITGMTDFVDDCLGVNSGSNPLAGGYCGFGFQSSAANLRGFIDAFEAQRQL